MKTAPPGSGAHRPTAIRRMDAGPRVGLREERGTQGAAPPPPACWAGQAGAGVSVLLQTQAPVTSPRAPRARESAPRPRRAKVPCDTEQRPVKARPLREGHCSGGEEAAAGRRLRVCLASTRARSLWLSGDRQPNYLTGKELLPPEKPVRATRAGHRHGWQVGVTVLRPPCCDANAKCLSFKCYVHTPRTAGLLPEVTQEKSRLMPRGASLREFPAGPAHAPTGQIAADAEKCAPHCAAG